MNVDYVLIGMRIKQKRKEKQLTQEQLAEAVEVSVGYISQIERGITRANLEMLSAICSELDCSLSYLFDGVDTRGGSHSEALINEKISSLNHDQRRLLCRIIDAISDNG